MVKFCDVQWTEMPLLLDHTQMKTGEERVHASEFRNRPRAESADAVGLGDAQDDTTCMSEWRVGVGIAWVGLGLRTNCY